VYSSPASPPSINLWQFLKTLLFNLSTIVNADEILVLADGKLVERGSHHELLAAQGTYQRLHAMQFKDF